MINIDILRKPVIESVLTKDTYVTFAPISKDEDRASHINFRKEMEKLSERVANGMPAFFPWYGDKMQVSKIGEKLLITTGQAQRGEGTVYVTEIVAVLSAECAPSYWVDEKQDHQYLYILKPLNVSYTLREAKIAVGHKVDLDSDMAPIQPQMKRGKVR